MVEQCLLEKAGKIINRETTRLQRVSRNKKSLFEAWWDNEWMAVWNK